MTNNDLTAWEMCCSILTGMREAQKVARGERAEILAAANGYPFAPGVSASNQIIEALIDATQSIEADMHRLARSSGLTMPEVKR